METIQMRTIRYFVVHCTETDTTKKAQEFYHEDGTPKFHYVIDRNGEVVSLCSNKYIINFGNVKSKEALHIAYIGGINNEGKHIDNLNKLQQEALLYKLIELSHWYFDVTILGAKDLGLSQHSPCFDVKEWMNNYVPDLSLDKENFSMAA